MIAWLRMGTSLSMPEKGRIEHALHNEEICNLLSTTKFKDWVVTTAFYSALHFVRHKIFPIKKKTEKGETFKIESFNQYSKAFNPKQLGKHELILDLVRTECPEAYADYLWLFNTCMNARYHDFKVSERVANKTVEKLHIIKEFCTQPATPSVKVAKPAASKASEANSPTSPAT